MLKKDLVKVKRFEMIGQDERGATLEFSLPRLQGEFVYITRKKNTLSGNTYHEGKNPGTNPKTFVLLTGKILFSYRKSGTLEKFSEEIEAPAVIEVAPYVIHKVETLNDSTLLECNSIQDIQNDRIKEEV